MSSRRWPWRGLHAQTAACGDSYHSEMATGRPAHRGVTYPTTATVHAAPQHPDSIEVWGGVGYGWGVGLGGRGTAWPCMPY
jgi:hypothetical protein